LNKEIGKVKFSYYGIAIYEVEIIYNILIGHFEDVDEFQLQTEDNQYAGLVKIEFPVSFTESFFQLFTFERWFQVKSILKEMKRRRGKKGLWTSISFNGITSELRSCLIFLILNKDNRHFEMAVEKIEYLVDLIPIQLIALPCNIEEIYYNYDQVTLKWNPQRAIRDDGTLYFFKDNKWIL
jgi:hypothetical protein